MLASSFQSLYIQSVERLWTIHTIIRPSVITPTIHDTTTIETRIVFEGPSSRRWLSHGQAATLGNARSSGSRYADGLRREADGTRTDPKSFLLARINGLSPFFTVPCWLSLLHGEITATSAWTFSGFAAGATILLPFVRFEKDCFLLRAILEVGQWSTAK